MFWDKKKEDKSLPDLPPIKRPLDFPQRRNIESDLEDLAPIEKHELPSFPDSPIEKGFSQSAIKDAVNTDIEKEDSFPQFPASSRNFKTIEMEEWTPPSKTEIKRTLELPEESEMPERLPPTPSATPSYSSPIPRSKEIFVKIDKFNSAKRSLDSIKDSLDEIDSLLKKVRETKLREEQELSAWEKEILSVKSRIQTVTENIFEKID